MTTKIISVQPDATVAETLSLMEKNQIHEVLVMKGDALQGWVSYRSLVRRAGLGPQSHITSMIERRPQVNQDASPFDAAEIMIHNNVRAVHVVDRKNQLVGVLSRTDLLGVAAEEPRLRDLPVDSIMNPELETVEATEPLDRAVHRLRELQVRQFLVVDKNGKLDGYAGLEELLRALSAEHYPHQFGSRNHGTHPGSGPRKEFKVEVKGYVREAPQVPVGAKLAEAARLMRERGTNFVAVVEDGFAVGVLSRSNVVERLAQLNPPKEGVMCQIIGLNHDHDQATLEHIYDMAQNTLRKISNEARNLEFLNLHYKVYKAKAEGDQKYALSLHLGTGGRFMVQKADAWDPVDATRIALELLEQRVMEQKGLRLDRRKGTPRRKTEFYSAA